MSRQRRGFAGEPVGVALAVPALVVMQHDRPHRGEELQALEHAVSDEWMGAHER